MPDTVNALRERLGFLTAHRRTEPCWPRPGGHVERLRRYWLRRRPSRRRRCLRPLAARHAGGFRYDYRRDPVACRVSARRIGVAAPQLVAVLLSSATRTSLRVLHEIESDVSRYLVTVTAINAGLGFLVGSAMASLGVGGAVVWAWQPASWVIPYADATLGSAWWRRRRWLPRQPRRIGNATVGFLALQILEGAFITPMILGRRLSLSQIAILTVLR